MIAIIAYQEIYQKDIDGMMREIASEFKEPISDPRAALPARWPDAYWIALYNNTLAGTAGIIGIGNGCAVLKRMMVRQPFRGKVYGTAARLLQRALQWSREKGLSTVYLGTMAQFRAAQQFYEKHGFRIIAPAQLPDDFPHNALDTVFYKLDLYDA